MMSIASSLVPMDGVSHVAAGKPFRRVRVRPSRLKRTQLRLAAALGIDRAVRQ
jgi:hypothetical protein